MISPPNPVLKAKRPDKGCFLFAIGGIPKKSYSFIPNFLKFVLL